MIRSLTQIISWRATPQVIRCAVLGFRHDGPGNISGKIQTGVQECGIRVDHIQPDKPQQNSYVERFNRPVRYKWLPQSYWSSIESVQDFAKQWLWSRNHDAPTGPWAVSSQCSIGLWLHNHSTFRVGGNLGITRAYGYTSKVIIKQAKTLAPQSRLEYYYP